MDQISSQLMQQCDILDHCTELVLQWHDFILLFSKWIIFWFVNALVVKVNPLEDISCVRRCVIIDLHSTIQCS